MPHRFLVRDPFSNETTGPFSREQLKDLIERETINAMAEVARDDAPNNWKPYRWWLKEWEDDEALDPFFKEQRAQATPLKIGLKKVQKQGDLKDRIEVEGYLKESEETGEARVAAEDREVFEAKKVLKLAVREGERERLQLSKTPVSEAQSALKLGKAKFEQTPDFDKDRALDPGRELKEYNAFYNSKVKLEDEYDPNSELFKKSARYRSRRYRDWINGLVGGLVIVGLIGGLLYLLGALGPGGTFLLAGGYLLYGFALTYTCLVIMR